MTNSTNWTVLQQSRPANPRWHQWRTSKLGISWSRHLAIAMHWSVYGILLLYVYCAIISAHLASQLSSSDAGCKDRLPRQALVTELPECTSMEYPQWSTKLEWWILAYTLTCIVLKTAQIHPLCPLLCALNFLIVFLDAYSWELSKTYCLLQSAPTVLFVLVTSGCQVHSFTDSVGSRLQHWSHGSIPHPQRPTVLPSARPTLSCEFSSRSSNPSRLLIWSFFFHF